MRVLVVTDMQNDFVNGSLGTKEAVEIVDSVKAKIDSYLSAGDTIIYTQDTHTEGYLQTQEGQKLSVEHCIKGTPGWRILPRVYVSGCKVIEKPSFGSIELAEYIAVMKDVQSTELIGICTDICVISNAMILKAKMPEVPILVDASCCAGTTLESHKNALNAMKACQIEVMGEDTMKQCDKRNISMMMDLYEMTMANGYFSEQSEMKQVAFDVFYRKNPDNGGFSIFAGLEQIIEYVENLHFDEEDIEYFRSLNLFSEDFLDYLNNFRFKGDIYAFKEGTIMYPNEPIITVIAPLIDAQLVETAILAQINHQSLIATKTRRIVRAADGRAVSDFGARRAHNMDAAIYGARAAYIGGANSTSNVMAGKQFGIPVSGTMAHSWVMFYNDEYEAFRHHAENYPDSTVLLVDTYDVIRSGIPNAIRVAREVLEPMGKRLKGIRLDSGDLAYLSKKVRRMLDDAGLNDCKIFVSNSLDEYTIASILNQGGDIDGFGVGERLITAKSDPVFGAVYKIAAVEENGTFVPRIKVSETVEKITNPGLKKVYRIYTEGNAIGDLITGADEILDMDKPYRYVDPEKPWKNHYFKNCTAKELQQLVVKGGERIYQTPSLEEIRKFVEQQLQTEIWKEEQRFENPHKHYLNMSPYYYELKMSLLHESQTE